MQAKINYMHEMPPTVSAVCEATEIKPLVPVVYLVSHLEYDRTAWSYNTPQLSLLKKQTTTNTDYKNSANAHYMLDT